jgi:gliding-associated putative ABC transporter substrate-binding component GldG
MKEKFQNIIKDILKFQKEASFSATVLLTVAIVVVLNFLAYQIFFRIDLTKNRDYSISPVTKDVLKNLDDVVSIKTYFSGNSPAQFIQVKKDVADILEAYQNYSGGKIDVEAIDPSKDPSIKADLTNKGIPEIQFNDYGQDKFQVINGFMGLAIEYNDKTEVIPMIQDTNNFEYQLTTKIKKITQTKEMSVGYVTSNGTASMDEDLKTVSGGLRTLYDLVPVDLSDKASLPKDISTLIIVGPTKKFSDDQLKKIDSFLMSGGSVAIYADGVSVDRSMKSDVLDVNLNKLLEKYGLKINNDLVIDSSAGVAAFNQGFVTFNIEYPYWPRLTAGSFAKDNPAVAKLNNVTLPWVSSITVSADDKISGRREVLAHTSNRSSLITGKFDLNPQQDFRPTDVSEHTVAVLVSGKLKSAYGKGETDKGRLLVVSDADFMRDIFLQNQPDNANFFSNAIDSLALDQNFALIRAKGVTSHPLKSDLTEAQKAQIRYGNVFGLTVVVMAYGLYRYSARRRKKQESLT